MYTLECLGSGYEGTVYKIDTRLVMKKWCHNIAGKCDLQGVVNRFKEIERVYASLPEDVKEKVAIPEFVGYEEGRDGEVITYHEFIDGQILIDITKLPEIICHTFKDWGGDNNRVVNGKIYLVDCPVINSLTNTNNGGIL